MENFGLIGVVIVFLLVGVGIALGLVACAAMTGLAGLGVISSSLLVGFWKRRAFPGVQVFFVQCGVLIGAPAGAVLAWGAAHLWPLISSDWHVLISGAVGGTAGGLAIAWLASAAAAVFASRTVPWLKGRMTMLQRSEA